MRRYPIGVQDFGKIREDNLVYVDKTQIIHTLITTGYFYFLSRPRRFGKSLLLSTIKAIFEGKKELFRKLWIEDNWDWNKKLPVIHLKLSSINYQELGLYEALNKEISSISIDKNIELLETDLKDKFKELIVKTAAGGKVVILVDEYDKPIIDYLDDIAILNKNKAVFKNFYSVLKDADPHIRFLLITGVSKFSKVSVFSDLNNLNDLTFHPRYNTLVGLTQEEVEHTFQQEIQEMQVDNPAFLEEMKNWYNGYSWDGKKTLYNPFSILRFMEARVFQNFWFETGTPTFLINTIRKKNGFDFEETETGIQDLSDFVVEDLRPVPLLFQTGYLTIKSYNAEDQLYHLTYPNKEVRSSMLAYLLGAYRNNNAGESLPLAVHLRKALQQNDIAAAVTVINTAFAAIPYDLWRGATELHYHALVHLLFSLLGAYINSEVHTSNGRCDAIVQTTAHVYALEFKLDATADEALQQIINKNYLAPFALDGRVKIAVGINFSSQTKKVADYLTKELTKST